MFGGEPSAAGLKFVQRHNSRRRNSFQGYAASTEIEKTVKNVNVSSSPADAGGVVPCTRNLDEFDILSLADMALECRQRLFEATGIPWPENEMKDAIKISMLQDKADEWGVMQAEDPSGFLQDVEVTVALARQYFTVEGVE